MENITYSPWDFKTLTEFPTACVIADLRGNSFMETGCPHVDHRKMLGFLMGPARLLELTLLEPGT